MIKISKLADYAVVVLSVLSKAEGKLISAHGLAEETHIPEPTVAKVTKKLANAGLIESTRGVRGGYKLAKPADELSVLEIIEAIDGPVMLTDCVDHNGAEDCSFASRCPSLGRWDKVNDVINGALGALYLEDMVRENYQMAAIDQNNKTYEKRANA